MYLVAFKKYISKVSFIHVDDLSETRSDLADLPETRSDMVDLSEARSDLAIFQSTDLNMSAS